MTTDRTSNIQYPRLLAEGAAILISILLAFSIDAWWDDRQRQENERIMLQSLLDDLKGKKRLLESSRRFNEAMLDSATTLLRAATDPDEIPSEDSIDRLIGQIWYYNLESNWDSGAMNSLISGGDILLFSNARLFQHLASLQDSFGRIKTLLGNDGSFHHDTLTPFLIAKAYLPQIQASVEHAPGIPENINYFPELRLHKTYDHSELLASVEFQNMLTTKIDRITDILKGGYSDVDGQLDATIELLETELAN